jgi:hypothetical protein
MSERELLKVLAQALVEISHPLTSGLKAKDLAADALRQIDMDWWRETVDSA